MPRGLFAGPEDKVALVVFVILAVVIFAQFFFRYVVNQSIGWTEELARFLLVVVVFVASIGAVRRSSHIAVNVLSGRVSGLMERLLATLVGIGSTAFYAYAGWLAVNVAERAWRQSMSTLPISRGWLYSIVAVAFVLMALRGLQSVIALWRQGGGGS